MATSQRDALEFGDSKERIIDRMRPWCADFIRSVAYRDRKGVRLLLTRISPVETQAALLLLAEMSAHAPRAVAVEVTRPAPDTERAA